MDKRKNDIEYIDQVGRYDMESGSCYTIAYM
jgi:hypothetical protein